MHSSGNAIKLQNLKGYKSEMTQLAPSAHLSQLKQTLFMQYYRVWLVPWLISN